MLFPLQSAEHSLPQSTKYIFGPVAIILKFLNYHLRIESYNNIYIVVVHYYEIIVPRVLCRGKEKCSSLVPA